MITDRRRKPRQRSLLGGSAAFTRRYCTMDCVVKNVSGDGALVVFPHSSVTPLEFNLHIPQRQQTLSAKVVWRKHDRVGVALSETEATEIEIEPAQRIRQLEVENQRLRKQLDPGRW